MTDTTAETKAAREDADELWKLHDATQPGTKERALALKAATKAARKATRLEKQK